VVTLLPRVCPGLVQSSPRSKREGEGASQETAVGTVHSLSLSSQTGRLGDH